MSTLQELRSAIDDGAMVERVRTEERVMRCGTDYAYAIDTTFQGTWRKVCASFDELPPLLHDTDGWRIMPPSLEVNSLSEWQGWCEAWRIQCIAGEWKA